MSKAQCSWCWKGAAEVAVLIEGQVGVYICDECAELCAEIARKKKAGLPIADGPLQTGMPPRVEEALERLGKVMGEPGPGGTHPPKL
jgi:ATP-dependent Clp protease ATP-binding subunit ClpX